MIETLEEAEKLRDKLFERQKEVRYLIPQVSIIREVRYFANYNGIRYPLIHDWNVELLDEKLDKLKREEA